MTLTTVLLLVLVLILVGTLPAWPHSNDWGYGPSTIVGLLVIGLLALMLMDRL
ncbi:DUF3309 family protein [Lacisediminimonas sp.]|uniref:DUF3309 family protein n=1 Tax=Lacisediminimonas sp. TaxID=3060582 RepID=UPI0027253CA3|nr:DUF3309 family protein [Lacisediminimonas sp.]MDO8300732.1 DUF3309 family protein [Lacisediminimonas sp.]MDO9219044.1 DUF3309 family protein [Lacisediminimonas sp.]